MCVGKNPNYLLNTWEKVNKRFAGDWLCHLAETTSQQESLRDERLMKVFIASRATMRLSLEVNDDTDDVSEATVGSEIKISCISGEDL